MTHGRTTTAAPVCALARMGVAAWCVFASQLADAAIPSRVVPGERWAVIVAIDRYEKQFSPAEVEKVAADLATTLQTSYGYDRDHIVTLYGGEATGDRILGLRGDLQKRVKRGDTVLVAALTEWHTLPPGGTALVPANGVAAQSWTLLSLDDIRELVASIEAASTLVLLDRCVRADANSLNAQAQTKGGAYFSGSRSPAVIVSGCDRTSSARGGFVARVIQVLRDWNPEASASGSSALTLKELLYRVSSTRAFVDVDVLDLGGGELTLTFTRAGGGLDSTLEASIQNRSSDPQKRLEALGALVDTVALERTESPRAADTAKLLESMLSDRSESELLRVAAARYLGRLKYVRSTGLLAAVSQDESMSPAIRVAALESLVPLDPVAARQSVVQGLSASNAEVRAAAVVQSANVTEIDVGLLLQRLQVEDAEAPLVALVQTFAAVQVPPPSVVPPMLNLIESSRSPRARREAMRLIGRLGDEESYGALAAVLANGSEPFEVRQDAAYAIGKIKYAAPDARQRAAEQLARAAEASDPGLRRGVADSLGRLGVASTRKNLETLARDGNATVREVAVRSLGQFGDAAARPVLEEALRDKSSVVRRAAAQSLGELGERGAIPALQRVATDDSDAGVRRAATKALDVLDSGESSAQIKLQVISRSEDPRSKAQAIRALAPRDDPRTIAVLIAVLADEETEPREAAIGVLARTPGTEVTRQLGAALASRDDDTRRGAAQALGRVGEFAEPDSPPWREALKRLVSSPRDPDDGVRAAIARALGSFAEPAALQAILSHSDRESYDVMLAAADGLRGLGQAYSRRGDMKMAIDAGERAVALRQKLVGVRHPDVATDYNDLGAYYLLAEDYARAEENLVSALRIREATLGVNDLNTAVSLANLAALHQRRKDFRLAASLYQSVLNTRQSLLPRGDPAVIQVLENLVGVYTEMGDTAGAERYTQEIRELRAHVTATRK